MVLLYYSSGGEVTSLVLLNFHKVFQMASSSIYPWVYFFVPHLMWQRKILCGIFNQIAEIPEGHVLE